jgi:hypothetical protein
MNCSRCNRPVFILRVEECDSCSNNVKVVITHKDPLEHVKSNPVFREKDDGSFEFGEDIENLKEIRKRTPSYRG